MTGLLPAGLRPSSSLALGDYSSRTSGLRLQAWGACGSASGTRTPAWVSRLTLPPRPSISAIRLAHPAGHLAALWPNLPASARPAESARPPPEIHRWQEANLLRRDGSSFRCDRLPQRPSRQSPPRSSPPGVSFVTAGSPVGSPPSLTSGATSETGGLRPGHLLGPPF
jgi:hypothetical protein